MAVSGQLFCFRHDRRSLSRSSTSLSRYDSSKLLQDHLLNLSGFELLSTRFFLITRTSKEEKRKKMHRSGSLSRTSDEFVISISPATKGSPVKQYVVTPTNSSNNGGQEDDDRSSGYVLPVSDSEDFVSKKECHTPSSSSPPPGGLLRPDKAVHLIPFVILSCALVLWFFSSPPDVASAYQAKSSTGSSNVEVKEEQANATSTTGAGVDAGEQEQLGGGLLTGFSFIGRKVERRQPEIDVDTKDEGTAASAGPDRLGVDAARRNELVGAGEGSDSAAAENEVGAVDDGGMEVIAPQNNVENIQ